MRLTKVKVLKIASLLILIGTVSYFVILFFTEIQKYKHNTPVGIIGSVSEEYLSLFDKKNIDKLYPGVSFKRKNNYAISRLAYQDTCDILVGKINADKKLISDNITVLQKGDEKRADASYGLINNNLYDISFRADTAFLVSNINMILKGDTIKTTVYNDSTVSYFSTSNYLSLTFNKLDEPEIFMSMAHLPINVLFVKRGKFIYYFITTVNGKNYPLPPNLTYSLINKG